MAIFKCKMCGGTLEITGGETVATCEYCGTKQTLPRTDDDVVSTLFNRANNLRLKCEFDKAAQIYEKIVEQDGAQAEAYWGIVLCKYGIEYVEDPKTLGRIPTCHRTLFEAVTANADYLAAVEHADAAQRGIYEAEARAIDVLQKDILAIVKNEKPFDVFLCYKETDEYGKRTVDSAIANDIYHQLTQEGFKVFYAAITLEDKLGQAYEPYIFAALNSAKVMLVLGTKPEYFTAVWVKNEWSRFLHLMKTDRSKLLIPCYRDMDAYDLPEEFAHLQAQDMSKIGFINDVVRGIKKVAYTAAPAPTVVKETVITGGNTNTAPLLKRAFMFLEDGEWERADEFCEQVLNLDPECAEAYLGKLMAELRVTVKDALSDQEVPFDSRNNYQKTMRFADDTLKAELAGYIDYINTRNENERLDGIYSRAISKMRLWSFYEYREAIRLFESISGWKDADEQAAVCRQRLEEMVAAQEAERLERERLAELEKQKAARKKRKLKITAGVVVSCIGVVTAFVILLTTVIIPNVKYNNAVELMESGDVVEAYETLIALGGYKDSAEKAASIYAQYRIENLKTAQVGDTVLFGIYEQDNNVANGQEDIEWLVLEVKDGKALVISKYGLDCEPYNTAYTDVTWETCTLRTWLNNEFITMAFSEEERAMIPTVTVTADKNPQYNTDPGNDTQDKVFLLSITEANTYFSSNIARTCEPTDYAADAGDFENAADNCRWWLRSSGSDKKHAAYVEGGGTFDTYGNYVDRDYIAVRPAMWITLPQ